jgi:hypothetical protein
MNDRKDALVIIFHIGNVWSKIANLREYRVNTFFAKKNSRDTVSFCLSHNTLKIIRTVGAILCIFLVTLGLNINYFFSKPQNLAAARLCVFCNLSKFDLA